MLNNNKKFNQYCCFMVSQLNTCRTGSISKDDAKSFKNTLYMHFFVCRNEQQLSTVFYWFSPAFFDGHWAHNCFNTFERSKCPLFQGDVKSVQYPVWCYFIIAFLICASCICIPAVFILRLFQRVTGKRKRDSEIVRDLLQSSINKKSLQSNEET